MKPIYYIRYVYSLYFKCEIIVNKDTLQVKQIKFIQKLDKNYTNTNNGIILFAIEEIVKYNDIKEGDIYRNMFDTFTKIN